MINLRHIKNSVMFYIKKYGILKTIKKCIKVFLRKLIRFLKGKPDTNYGFYPDWLKENQISVAEVKENKKAEFEFSAEKSGIYSIECSEACMSEYDCYFTVFDSDNNPIADKLFIHSNEWISRKVFLPKGEYKITVEDVFAVATCTVKTEKIFENVASENDENLKLPLKIGFVADENNSVTAEFEAQSGKLVATASGTDTYYDSEQDFKIEITDKNGNILLREEYEGSMEWNIPESFGKGFVKLTLEGNGIVDLRIE